MNLIDILRSGKEVEATRAFSYLSPVSSVWGTRIDTAPGRIGRDFFIRSILPGLSEEQLLSEDLWKPYEGEGK